MSKWSQSNRLNSLIHWIINLNSLTQLNDMEYRAVKLRGEFIHDKELYIGPRSFIEHKNESKDRPVFGSTPKSGYLVVTPFKLEGREYVFKMIAKFIHWFYNSVKFWISRETVLINRGWVPRNCLKPETRESGQVKGVHEITGVVRKNENRPQFMPKSEGKYLLYR